MPLIPVILCGGAGSRLWPVSRELHPKPFIRLSDNQSLLQKAFLRAANLESVDEIITVTNRDLFFKTEEELRKVNSAVLNTSFILEPVGRNTSAAIAAALLHIIKIYGKDTVILVLAADHLVDNQEAFARAVTEARVLAQQDKLVTFGIRPHAPETGYGYIEAEGSQVLRFVEKPSIEKAREYFDSGRFLWNSGMFCFKAETMRQAMTQYCKDILESTEKCLEKSHPVENSHSIRIELDIASFKKVRDSSIDYAVMEQAQNVAVVPCSIGWSDIGSWDTLGELHQADAQGNRIDGEALLRDVSNSYIQSDKRVVGAVGVDNLIIVDTPDALLVADKRCAQDVKHLYEELKAKGHDTHKNHLTVYRPWGTYTVLEENPNFKVKRIEVKPGASLSLQMHHHRSEHWIVVSGMAKVVNGDNEFFVKANESTYIPAGHKHRLENPGVLNLVMIEVQSGEYFGEDDIVRFQDTYGHA